MKLASIGDDIKLWDCNGFTKVKQFNPHSASVSSVCWSHDNSVLASASSAGDKIVLTYSDTTSYSKDIAIGEGRTCVSFNSMSRFVIGGGLDGVIHIWDLKTMKLKKSYTDHRGALTSLQFNFDDSVIASASETGEIILYNVKSGHSCSPLITQKGQAVRQVQYSHFKKSLLGSVCDNGVVSLWDTNRNALTHAFTDTHSAPATGLAFSPVNEMLLMSVGLDKKIVCYDVLGKIAVKTMVAESPLTSVSLMQDGATIAAGSIRGKIYIYDLRTGATPMRVISAHKSSVKCLAFEEARNKPRPSSIGNGGKEPKVTTRKSNASGSSSGSHTSPQQLSNQKASNGSTSEAVRNSHPGNIDRSYLSTTGNDGTNVSVSSRRGTWGNMEMFSPLRETDGTITLSSFDSTVPRDSLGMTIDHSTNQYTDGIFSPVGEHADSRGHLTDSTSDSTGVSPAMTTRSIPGGLSLHDVYVSVDNGHSVAAGDIGGPPDGPNGRASGYCGTPDGQSGPPGVYTGTPGGYSGAAVNEQPTTGMLSGCHASSEVPSLPHRAVSSPHGRGPLVNHDIMGSSPRGRGSSGGHRPSLNHDIASSSSAQDLPTASADARAILSEGDLPRGLRPHNAAQPARTPTGALPSAEGDGAAAAYLPPQSFPTQFIKNIIEDVLDDFREQIRRDILDVHTSMLKQFLIQQSEMQTMLQQYSLNPDLLAEIERLREENSRLKKNY